MDKNTQEINATIRTLNRSMEALEKKHFEVWTKDVHFEGYGFKVIFEDYYIDVWAMLNYNDITKFYISKYQRQGNILDTFSNPLIKEEETTDKNELLDIILNLVK